MSSRDRDTMRLWGLLTLIAFIGFAVLLAAALLPASVS
jgi:hypothetical protein